MFEYLQLIISPKVLNIILLLKNKIPILRPLKIANYYFSFLNIEKYDVSDIKFQFTDL